MEFIISIATITAIYALLSLALNIRYGQAGLPDFGIAGFFLIGAYASAITTAPPQALDVVGGGSLAGNLQWHPFLGILVSMLTCYFVALAIGFMSLRAIKGDFFAVATIGLAEVLRWIAINEHSLSRGPQGIKDIPGLFGTGITEFGREIYLSFVLLVLGIVVLAIRRLSITGFGRALRILREDETVAQSLGRNPRSYKLKAYALGGVIAGIAGSLWVHFAGAVQPSEFTPELSFIVWACVIIGGRGNSIGVVLGTVLVIGFFEQATRFLPSISGYPQALPALRMIAIGLMLLVMLRFRSEGLCPERLVVLSAKGQLKQ